MSKSDPSGCLFLDDDIDIVAAKIRKAQTDSINGISYDRENRVEMANLIEIFSGITGQEPESVAQQYSQAGHSVFKADLISAFVEKFKDYRDSAEVDVDSALSESEIEATEMAESIYNKILEAVGFANS